MMGGFEEETTGPISSSSSNGGEINDVGNFECNICFELAQDPIVTLCGHLFCWPCIYRWLHYHSLSQECPVCKALIQESKLVPLYGRGKTNTDPRSRPLPGADIPNRPLAQRPQTAPSPPRPNHNLGFGFGFGFFGGFMPMASARFGNASTGAGFGGFFPSLMSLQLNGFRGGAIDRAVPGYPYGYPESEMVHGVVNEYYHLNRMARQAQDLLFKSVLLCIAFLVLIIFVGDFDLYRS